MCLSSQYKHGLEAADVLRQSRCQRLVCHYLFAVRRVFLRRRAAVGPGGGLGVQLLGGVDEGQDVGVPEHGVEHSVDLLLGVLRPRHRGLGVGLQYEAQQVAIA